MRKTTLTTIAALAAVGLALTGCGRNVDVAATGAEPVPGARALFRFCDGPTLIYFSSWDASADEYEWFYPGGCAQNPDGRWVISTVPPDYAVPNGDSTDQGHDQ